MPAPSSGLAAPGTHSEIPESTSVYLSLQYLSLPQSRSGYMRLRQRLISASPVPHRMGSKGSRWYTGSLNRASRRPPDAQPWPGLGQCGTG